VERPNSGEERPDTVLGHDQGRSASNEAVGRPSGVRTGSGRANEGTGVERVDEFAIIDRLRGLFEAATAEERRFSDDHVEVGIGDDAAVITIGEGGDRVVVSTDLVVERVHFDLRVGTPDDAGWKALMAAASDLAAMGAAPRFALLSLTAPTGRDLDRFGAGVADASSVLGCPVVGGDLSTGPALVASVTVAGTLPADGRPALLRSGAHPGDLLFVTGPLGMSAAGLRQLRAGKGVSPELALAYLRPTARIAEGTSARRGGATAAIDISDGLAADVRHLALASGVGVELEAVPAAEGVTDEEAVGGGEDFELLMATPDPAGLRATFAEDGLRDPLLVGRCTDEIGHCRLHGRPLDPAGWRHWF
jgi:thiamine-monophosphate kinase